MEVEEQSNEKEHGELGTSMNRNMTWGQVVKGHIGAESVQAKEQKILAWLLNGRHAYLLMQMRDRHNKANKTANRKKRRKRARRTRVQRVKTEH